MKDEKEEMKISRLTVYPLKSCKGIDVKHARLTETGFEWDRCFCVIDKDGGLSVRELFRSWRWLKPSFAGSSLRKKRMMMMMMRIVRWNES